MYVINGFMTNSIIRIMNPGSCSDVSLCSPCYFLVTLYMTKFDTYFFPYFVLFRAMFSLKL